MMPMLLLLLPTRMPMPKKSLEETGRPTTTEELTPTLATVTPTLTHTSEDTKLPMKDMEMREILMSTFPTLIRMFTTLAQL